MNQRLKRISGRIFLGILIVGMVAGIVLPDLALSTTERRKLAQLPEISISNILSDSFSDSLETYLLDQFPGRDIFRTIKTEFDTLVLGKTDSNGYVKIGNHLFEIRTSYDTNQVTQAAELFQAIVEKYFQDSNVYYSVIPDKNYFVESLPKYDYEMVDEILRDTLVVGNEISKDILVAGNEIYVYDQLELDDFYDTDLHAKQEALLPLANALLQGMGSESEGLTMDDYEKLLASDEFYGGYSANSAYLSDPDMLYYLVNEMLENATVYDYETGTTGGIYTLDKLDGMDYYDIFLGGARALLTMQNPEVENGKKLIIFRDSFGSSIAPLLLSEYEEITLVDLRYVSADYAMNLLEMTEGYYDDVLFLYQVEVLYNSNSFKK